MARILPALSPLLLSLALPLSGCAIERDEIDSWPRTTNGEARLGAYLADGERPMELRMRAAQHLMSAGAMAQIMTSVEGTPKEARGPLLDHLAAVVTACVGDLVTEPEGGEKPGAPTSACDNMERDLGPAVNLGFLLLEQLPEGKQRDKLVKILLTAAADKSDEDIPGLEIRVDDLLLACTLKAPKITVPQLLERLQKTEDPKVGVRIAGVLSQIKDAEIRKQLAEALLSWVKPRYKTLLPIPQIRDVLAKTRNPTLIKFMMDAARDTDLDFDTRDELVARGIQLLSKEDAAERLYLLLAAQDNAIYNEFRWTALDALWAQDPLKHLGPMMRALPTASDAWSTAPNQLKGRINHFCDVTVKKTQGLDAEALMQAFESLLEHPSWVARTFAFVCISKLDPSGAPTRLSALSEDPATLPGWTEAGDSTLGAEVKALSGN